MRPNGSGQYVVLMMVIMGIFKVARDSYTLAQGWQKWATGKQPWKDSLKTMKWQGFEQEDSLIGFEILEKFEINL
jgi:hypothetical protein